MTIGKECIPATSRFHTEIIGGGGGGGRGGKRRWLV